MKPLIIGTLLLLAGTASGQFVSLSVWAPEEAATELDLGNFEPFDEVYMFEEGSTILQLGVGLRSDVVLENYNKEFMFPAISLLIEKPVLTNTGVGLILGTQWWSIPEFGFQYRYYNIGARVSYHFNFLDELDPYVAAGLTYKRVELTDGDGRLFEHKMAFNMLLGARYYFSDHFGGFLEVGSDNLSWFRLGLAMMIL